MTCNTISVLFDYARLHWSSVISSSDLTEGMPSRSNQSGSASHKDAPILSDDDWTHHEMGWIFFFFWGLPVVLSSSSDQSNTHQLKDYAVLFQNAVLYFTPE
uniref:AlNc14C105G6175 protein n=1 Tax=Albugo laibachii Nc14 TaxID=890382 RepID=F0WHW9_9STRA|nr:AlNc14C105G6175 [Albugo laibachii Nc14]|eukprot:CCA20845.1 AlNc14C105G6175 [Albugo laibachii Nc14]